MWSDPFKSDHTKSDRIKSDRIKWSPTKSFEVLPENISHRVEVDLYSKAI